MNISFIVSCLTALTVFATIISICMPILERMEIRKRIKSAALERDLIRKKGMEALEREDKNFNKNLRHSSVASSLMSNLVEKFNLKKFFNVEATTDNLVQAGFRGRKTLNEFLAFKILTPFASGLFSFFYITSNPASAYSFKITLLIIVVAAAIGYKLPDIYISNIITKRQVAIKRSLSEMFDLILICVESGMSSEHAFKKVAAEISISNPIFGEELTITTAEISYLPEKRMAYDNLARRTGLEGIKSLSVVLYQTEKYGTPLGQALRVLAQEARDERMMEAERKAAALPPKLTVPMIACFMPALLVVLLAPAILQLFQS